MEPVLIACYQEMQKLHPTDCSADRILEDPEFRNEFLSLVRASGVDKLEFNVLRTLHNLRKRSKLPRRDEDVNEEVSVSELDEPTREAPSSL